MPKITINGVDARVDGVYDLDLEEPFSYGELKVIKTVAGVRGAEIGEAMEAGDTDVIVALTKIALDRADLDVPVRQLMNAKIGAIQFGGPTEAEKAAEEKAKEDEAQLLPPPSASVDENEPTSTSKTSTNATSNGSDDTQVMPLPSIGPRASAPPSRTGSGSSPTT